MPKSRGRRPRKTARRQSPRRRLEQVRAQLPVTLSVLQAADAAEVRGDAAGALGVMMEHPVEPDGRPFWRPERVRRLSQLFVLGPMLPAWATSRWILAQALQTLDESNRGRSFEAMAAALRVRGGLGVLHSGHALDAKAKVVDHDWVYRELFLYELGGLAHFVRDVAPPDLLAGADRIEEWARAPMGGYRLQHETSRELTWQDLASFGEVRTVNLGGATMARPGDCVLGRVAPTEEGDMFESAPLVVPEGAALDVAADPDSWVDAVAKACRDEYPVSEDDDPCITGDFDFGMLTDVPRITQHWLQHVTAGIPITKHDQCNPGRLAAGLVHAALDGRLQGLLDEEGRRLNLDSPIHGWPSVAAALVEPHVSEHLMRALTPADSDALLRLAGRLPRPAADMCLHLAGLLREAA